MKAKPDTIILATAVLAVVTGTSLTQRPVLDHSRGGLTRRIAVDAGPSARTGTDHSVSPARPHQFA